MTASAPDDAILRTLLYADIFDYPLTAAEIHHFLIAPDGAAATPDAVLAALEGSPRLAGLTARVNGYVTMRDRQAIGVLRDERRRHAARLWPHARRWAAVIGALPFVRMVAVTGALAMDNSPPGDDVDFLIVTAPGRVWLTRALAVGVVRAARLFGVELCPNYVLAETALVQRQCDLYAAHDLAQMVPLVGHEVYTAMRRANAWALDFLPHAAAPLRLEADRRPRGWTALLQRLAERALAGRLGDALERWERGRKLARFTPAASQPGSAAELDADRVKGHFEDNGRPVLARYEQRLAGFFGPTADPP
jgi:hypothetical protein